MKQYYYQFIIFSNQGIWRIKRIPRTAEAKQQITKPPRELQQKLMILVFIGATEMPCSSVIHKDLSKQQIIF